MPSTKRCEYDDQLLVELIARGEANCKQIADQVGISREMVSSIARGKRRRDLQKRIAMAIENHRRETNKLGARWLKSLLTKHIRNGLAGDGETARKCREYALERFLGPAEESPDQSDSQDLPAPGLTAEDYEAIARLKGGPAEDEPTCQ